VGATIKVEGLNQTLYSDANGNFQFYLDSNSIFSIRITYLNHYTLKEDIITKTKNIALGNLLMIEKNLDVINIEYVRAPDFFDKFPPIPMNRIPTPTGNFEDLIKIAALGVSSSNELSSNYNVRGGNYDENDIFVNGVIQIYRPFLVRAGQQEGLSFIHGEFVQDIFFSAGGFDANYGDVLLPF